MTEPKSREEICCVRDFEQFRNLNAQMNHVPALAMTLTGGLWFGAGATENLDIEIRFALLMLAGFSNLALILIVYRIRDVLESYLERIETFHPPSFAGGTPQNPWLSWFGGSSMITIFSPLCRWPPCFRPSALSGWAGWKYWPFAICVWWDVATLGLLPLGLCLLNLPAKLGEGTNEHGWGR